MNLNPQPEKSGSQPVAYILTTAGSTIVGAGLPSSDYIMIGIGTLALIVGALIRLQIIKLDYKYGKASAAYTQPKSAQFLEGQAFPAAFAAKDQKEDVRSRSQSDQATA